MTWHVRPLTACLIGADDGLARGGVAWQPDSAGPDRRGFIPPVTDDDRKAAFPRAARITFTSGRCRRSC